MKRITIILMLVWTGFCLAQDSVDIDQMIIDGKVQIQEAVDTWDLNKMISTRGYFERLLNLEKSQDLLHYYIAYADYRIVGYYFSLEDLKSPKKYIDDSIDHLKKALELNTEFAEAHILLSSMYGNKIAVKPIMGMTLGMKTGTHANSAVRIAPKNPRVAFLQGSNAYYTPRMWGGGKDKALEHLKRALVFYGEFKPAAAVDPDWGLDDTHLYLGLTNLDLGNYADAKKHLDTCLELKPNHGWARALKAQAEEAIDKESK